MKDDRVYLGHIRDAIQDIEQYAAIGHDLFLADRMRQDAVIRKLEIIGEAVKNLSAQIRQERPEIPWKRLMTTSVSRRLIAGAPPDLLSWG